MVEYYVRDVGAAGSNPVTSITILAELSDMKSLFGFSMLTILLFNTNAAVVELADTRDLKSLGSDIVPVQVRSAALKMECWFFGIPFYFFKNLSA